MKFQGLLVITLIIFSLASFSLTGSSLLKDTSAVGDVNTLGSTKEENFIITPVFTGNEVTPLMSASSVLAVDLDSDISLFEKDSDAPHSPASTTKIVTALVAMDYYPLNKVLTVGNTRVYGQKMNLVPGENILVRDLLYGLLVYSANDAAEVLAQNYEGGWEAFVEAMNIKAEKFGLDHTFFTNPSGLDGDAHVTSSRDLVKVSTIAMKNPFFKQVVGTREKIVTSVDGKLQHRLVNLNELIGKVDGVLGVKTGWTENAKENLVTYIERDGKRVIIAVLGSQDRFGETQELINWIFNNYEWKGMVESSAPYSEDSASAP